MKVFVVGGDLHYANWIDDCKLTTNPKKADIIFFTGGEDVDPALYGAKKHPTTYCNRKRDDLELDVFSQVSESQLVIGVCRGSQFICVANGGLLVQNCNNHALWETHEITNGVDKYEITSTHHQMAYPFNLDNKDYDILYWAEHRSTIYEGDKINPEKIIKEPEITVYHKEGKPICLGIQGHPEMIPNYPVCKLLNKLILQWKK